MKSDVILPTSGMSVDEAIEWARQKIKEEAEIERARKTYSSGEAGSDFIEGRDFPRCVRIEYDEYER